MTKGNPFKLIVKFLFPIFIGNVFQQFYNMADTIIVGRFVGVQALAAVGATGTIMFLILGFMMGLSTGFTVLTAQRFGAGDIEGVKKSVGNGAVLSAMIAILLTIISIGCMDGLLRLMNTPEDIFQDAKNYIVIICAGIGCSVLYNFTASILRAVGNSKVPLYFLIISAALNIVIDIVFILQFSLGVAGAALATVASQGISGILCLIYIIKKVPLLNIQKEHIALDWYCVRNQLFIGVPMALQFSITAVGAIVLQGALNLLGSTVVAAYTAAGKVEQVLTQGYGALGMTMATYSAQNRGVNDLERIKAGTRQANLISAVYSIVAAVLGILLMPYLIRLFVSGDTSHILGYANTYITVCAVCFIPLGMIFIFRNVLQGAGFSLMPMMAGVIELFSRAIVAFIAAHYQSYLGVCIANVTAWVTAGVFLWIVYIVTMRKLCRQTKLTM